MLFDFKGKTIIVTGAGQGIGKEIAKGIVEGGGNVIICDINEETGNATAKDILDLMYIVKSTVKSKFGITLEEEVKILGED